ncbi:MAG: YggS family pyridoxal phosphate-dependent enzyme [Micavibrio aeruginosavorus]|uniref:Pyridoxal phosphate homeostasis protein n=1 Tax=Micavibrio aeruginosavorus TaxID=349221 RepID=A0A2W5Q4G4_9BACT|nr:MAG: YggS family pyridoxal phosphate-dependent enzyme [Micavibrio aeruginosavorus]
MTIAQNFEETFKKIRRAERVAGREEGVAQLVAVTKTQSGQALDAALAIGHRLFGENKVQEAQEHWASRRTSHPDLKLHLIGPLQTNKVKDAVALFDVIETLDRERLADALAAEMKKQGRDLPCFIQVNTGEEEQKSGIAPEEAPTFLAYCRALGLNVTGLMCIPPVDDAPALHFALLKKMAADLGLKNLSMGMSGDFEKAVALGATHVRIGTALFARGFKRSKFGRKRVARRNSYVRLQRCRLRWHLK